MWLPPSPAVSPVPPPYLALIVGAHKEFTEVRSMYDYANMITRACVCLCEASVRTDLPLLSSAHGSNDLTTRCRAPPDHANYTSAKNFWWLTGQLVTTSAGGLKNFNLTSS